MSQSPRPSEIVVLQHDPDTPPGLLGEWLKRRAIPHRIVRLDEGETPPADPRGLSGLVVLGSGHSVNASEPAWIAPELELVRQAVRANVPVLGICFGGQMLALATGASVGTAPRPSIGWCEVDGPADGVVAGRWLHFSYETFTVPEGAERLGELAGAPSAFRLGPHLGVQFHPEATVEIVTGWARWDAERLERLEIDPDPLIAASPTERDAAGRAASALFDSWL